MKNGRSKSTDPATATSDLEPSVMLKTGLQAVLSPQTPRMLSLKTAGRVVRVTPMSGAAPHEDVFTRTKNINPKMDGKVGAFVN